MQNIASKSLKCQQMVSVKPFDYSALDSIVAIETACSHFPWSRKNFSDSIDSHHLCLAAKIEDTYVGFIIVQAKTLDAELLLIAVLPEYQNKGIGKLLLNTVLDELKNKCERLFLEVRESNANAIAFYDQAHFNCMGERKNYYPTAKGYENALIYGYEFLL